MRRALVATLLAASAAMAVPASAAPDPDLKCVFLYDPAWAGGAVYVINCIHPILP